jgi:polysaccharide biosynthesis/export protein
MKGKRMFDCKARSQRSALAIGGLFVVLGASLFAPAFAQQQPQRPAAQPQATAATQQGVRIPDYALSAGDELEVSVWKEPDLTKTVVVRPDGKFSVPLAGEVQAAGRSTDQIQADITNRLKKYIPEAVVTVAITKLEGNRVYVIGQVNKPGTFTMNPRLNVLQALSMAGGMTPFAAVNDISVMRTTGGQQRMLPFRFGEVSRGRNLEQNVQLEAGDVVIVP